MLIIIPSFFHKEFQWIFPSDKYLIKFLVHLKEKEKDLIRLSSEYKKYKFNLIKLSIRWIIYIETIESNWKLIYQPIWIDKKSSKESQSWKRWKVWWYNIKLDKKTISFLSLRVLKLKEDLINWTFNRYEVINNNNTTNVYKLDISWTRELL